MSAPSLEVSDIRKEYPGTVALDGVSLTFRPGAVHAVIGKNGAGKSTLLKIVSGAVQPSAGRILLDGGEVSFHSPADALAKGVSTVYQEMSLVPGLSVAENILLGRMPKKKTLGVSLIDWRSVHARAKGILESLDIALDVREKVSGLDVPNRQMVEIAKAMSFEPRVLLLDEPTSALSRQGTRSLFELVRKLRARNVIIVYVTHRLQELSEIADTIDVLRDGKPAGRLERGEFSPTVIARLMFGQDVKRSAPVRERKGGKPGRKVLEVRNLSAGDRLSGVGFTLEEGEILGIAGTLGSGRTELLRALFGADRIEKGEVWIRGERVESPLPSVMRKLGLGLVPENRKEEGLVQTLSVRDNLCLASLEKVAVKGVVRRRLENALTARAVSGLQIAVSSPGQPVSTLSGGNQQKVVIGKWLSTEPAVILFDEPTRGIDIQAKQQIFSLIRETAGRGVGCVIVSTELEELLEVCHRILVLRKGRIVREFSTCGEAMLDLETLMAACMER
jgi:ribose transport system ATP-binding protein